MKNVFISFTADDRDKMIILCEVIKATSGIMPHVVERQEKDEALALSELVEKGIREAHYFIPIITSNSQFTQWVNQEIGFAKAVEDVKIIPLVETEIKAELKGFIHNQLQLTHRFRKDDNDHFLEVCDSLIKVIASSSTNKKSKESTEERMKRMDIMPYIEFGYLIESPPLIPATNRTVTLFLKNKGEGQASVFKIEGFEGLGNSIMPQKSHYSTPVRIDLNGNIEVPMQIIKHQKPHDFQVLVSFFDKYNNHYHQLAGYKDRQPLIAGPVLVKLAVN